MIGDTIVAAKMQGFGRYISVMQIPMERAKSAGKLEIVALSPTLL